jgi:hypothetical protein
VREDTPGDKRLVAYIVRKPGAAVELEQSALIAALKKSLPEYLVPSAIVALPALPRTPNGKLDRNALPAPHSIKPTGSFVAPQTPLEEKMAAVWMNVLGLKRIGMTDNFFDLGGHSLLGLRLVNQLREALGEHLALALVFETPTPALMANFLEKNFPASVARWIGSPAAVAPAQPTASVISVNRESRRVRRP